jgi:phosphotransferase system HPr (HPr) family protein
MKLLEKVTVQRSCGIDMPTAAQLAGISYKHDCGIKVQKGMDRVDAKDPLNLLSLDIEPGCELILYFEGEDTQGAATAVRNLLEG